MISNRTNGINAARLLIAVLALAAIRLTAVAQTPTSQYDRGTPPQHAAGVSAIGSYISADIGSINLSNGSLNFRLPMGSVGGRGFWLPLTLNYTSKLWSGSRGQVFVGEPQPGHFAAIAYANYNGGTVDTYNAVAPGWTVGAAPLLKARGIGIGPHAVPSGCKNFDWVLTKLTLVLPDKGEVELRDEQFNGAPISPTTGSDGCLSQDGASHGKRWHATDGSGVVFINDNNNGVINGNLAGVVITADGTRYHFFTAGSSGSVPSAFVNSLGRCDWVRDRNGNKVIIQYPTPTRVNYIDQLGRMTSVEFDVLDPQPPHLPLALLVTLPGYNGQVRFYKVTTGPMNQNYRSGINPALPVTVGGDPGVGTVLFLTGYQGVDTAIDNTPVLTQLILPDTRALTFKYNEFGEVAEVQMPTGGKVQYDYGGMAFDAGLQRGLPSGNSLAAEVVATGQGGGGNVHAVDRAVTTRRTYPDGSIVEGTWSYNYKIDKTEVTCTSNSTTLLDEWHYFLSAQRFLTGSTANGPDGTGYSKWSTGVESRSEVVDGSTTLSALEQDWSQRKTIQLEGKWTTGHSIQEVANDNRVNQTRKYLDDGSFSRVDTLYDQTLGDQNHVNNPVQEDEYDFDQTLKRRTTTSYFTGSPYTDTGVNTINILSLPHDQAVYDASDLGNPKSLTTYDYDLYTADGNNAPLQTYADYASIPGRTQPPETVFDATYLTRGNATKVTRMVTSNSTISSYTRYDVLGNVVSAKDPIGNVAFINYLDDFGPGASPGFNAGGQHTYALPTKITSPSPKTNEPAQMAYSQYDFSTGLLTGFKDRNLTITQTIYNDPFDRPTQIISALGITALENRATMYYAPQSNPFGVVLTKDDALTAKDQTGVGDGSLRSWTKTDGFGRTIENWTHAPDELYQGNPVSGDIVVKTNYDGLGRMKQTSNPYRPAVPTESAQYTETAYDRAGRVIGVTTLTDSATVSTAYDGPRVLVKDQAGKERLSKTDGLGRLIEVWEIRTPDSATEPLQFPMHLEVTAGYRSTYAYDALDDLKTTTQRIGAAGTTQTRGFEYDALKRLTQASNPENGVVSYTYDANSNLNTKLDARGITTTYEYDALNRVISRMYDNTNDPQSTPNVTYLYDSQNLPPGAPPSFDRGSSIGTLVSVTVGGTSAGTYRGYDALGRVIRHVQQTDGINYQSDANYNRAGEVTSEIYPAVPGYADRRTVSFNHDTAGRLTSLSSAPTSYGGGANVSAISYSAHGGLASETYGSGLVHAITYNSRLQPNQIMLGTAGNATSVLSLVYNYGTTANNGNVAGITYNGGGLASAQTYTYDALNRLSSASEKVGNETNPRWTQSYGYDRFSNRTSLTNTGELPAANAPSVDPTTNRLVGFNYDNAGNFSPPGKTPWLYDAENRLVQTGSSGPTRSSDAYDGEGRRVFKHLPGPQSGSSVYYVYDIAGRLVADHTYGPFGGVSSQEYVYGASGLVATIKPGNGTKYLTADHLGSPRVATNNSQGVVSRHDYLPFGEELSVGIGGRTVGMGYGATDGVRQQFTQKERDNESGLDYFLARYYSSAQGRFTSPDEFAGGPDELYDFAASASGNPTFYADLHEPQSLNKYQYCYNNPLAYVDPNGHQIGKKLKEAASSVAAAAGQVLKDTFVGGGKELYNAAVGVPNAINTVVDAGLSLTGTDFRFGQLPTAQASTPGESSAMLAVDVALIYQAATSLAAGEAASAVNAGRAATERAAGEARTPATQPYRRPSGATTAEQRASVQGQPCVECGKTAPKMVANHKTPLVQEHYQTGKIDTHRMRQVSAVNSHCPTCSAREGAQMSRYSREMRRKLPAQQ